MSRIERNWQYAEQYPNEPASVIRARRLALELGIDPVSPAVAAQLSTLVAATDARTLCEVGTGVGVSGLSLLRHAPNASLTTIEHEPEVLREARGVFSSAGVTAPQVRFVEGDARHVMPRLNLDAYDLVLLDASTDILLELFEHALGMVRPGGSILVPGALADGRVADPAARDAGTRAMRDLLAVVADSPAIAASLTSSGSGLLTIVKLAQ